MPKKISHALLISLLIISSVATVNQKIKLESIDFLFSIPTALAANETQNNNKSIFESLRQRIETLLIKIDDLISGNKSANLGNISGGNDKLETIGEKIKDINADGSGNSLLTEGKKQASEGNIMQWFKDKANELFGNGNKQAAQQQQQVSPETIAGQNPPQIGESPQQTNNAAGGENGTEKNPWKLEPNQFKKICGQNDYVLYWRKGGVSGKDMANPAGLPIKGESEGQGKEFILPTCEELAKCHCCCNTCTFPQGETCPSGWCFSKKTICDDKKECSNQCSDKCDDKCKKGCKDYKEPTHDKAFDRDCNCQQEGCPKGENCMILIKDPGNSDVKYTSKLTPKGHFNTATGFAYFMNGNGPGDEQSRVKVDSKDVEPAKGWVMKLDPQKGKCCKCTEGTGGE